MTSKEWVQTPIMKYRPQHNTVYLQVKHIIAVHVFGVVAVSVGEQLWEHNKEIRK